MWHEEKAHINVEEREIVAADRGAWRMMVKKGIEAAEKDRRDRTEEKDGIAKQKSDLSPTAYSILVHRPLERLPCKVGPTS